MKKEKSRRRKRRSSKGVSLASGAGLMRFFEDSGMGIKISPFTTIILAIGLISAIMMAHMGIFDWLF